MYIRTTQIIEVLAQAEYMNIIYTRPRVKKTENTRSQLCNTRRVPSRSVSNKGAFALGSFGRRGICLGAFALWAVVLIYQGFCPRVFSPGTYIERIMKGNLRQEGLCLEFSVRGFCCWGRRSGEAYVGRA